jgi:hypothetical protein
VRLVGAAESRDRLDFDFFIGPATHPNAWRPSAILQRFAARHNNSSL